MKISLYKGQPISGYSYLKPELRDKLIEAVIKTGVLPDGNCYKIDDNSSLADLFRSMDNLVDAKGLPAINWINSQTFAQLKKKIITLDSSQISPMKNWSGEYEESLIKREASIDADEIENNPNIEILADDSHEIIFSGSDFARDYLRKNGPNKRVHIQTCSYYPEFGESRTRLYIWVKK